MYARSYDYQIYYCEVDMTQFFNLLLSFFRALLALLNDIRFEFFGYEVTFLSVLVTFGIFGIICSVFWRGGKA